MNTDPRLRQNYAAAFARFLFRRDEAALSAAYELGRRSLESGISLLDIVQIHHAVVIDSLPGLEARHQLCRTRRFVVLVVGEHARALDPVSCQQRLRVPGVLAEDDVGGAQLSEQAQRDVLEIADRGGADGERHQRRSRYGDSGCAVATASASHARAGLPSRGSTASQSSSCPKSFAL